MTDTKTPTRDWSATLFLPQTPFPMRAGLPQLEPKLLERWAKLGLYHRLRAAAKGRPKFILHDGPPYANANIHLGTALNKILKDVVTRSQQMLGFDSNYVPGWDCHGLPIEWKIEEQYRAKGQDKDKVPVNEFRMECRRVRGALDRRADGGVQAPRRRGRLGPLLLDHGLQGRGHHRLRADEVRPQRRAVPRLQAGDVERGGEDRARRSRGRVPRLHERHGVGEVSCRRTAEARPSREAISDREEAASNVQQPTH